MPEIVKFRRGSVWEQIGEIEQMMQKETYEKIFQMIGSDEDNTAVWRVMGKLISLCAAICYAATILGRILLSQWRELGVLVLVPAISFVAVSVFRSVYNAKRPYELYGFEPLSPKKTLGKSFPSRHVFSIFVIAVTVGHYYPEACIGLGLAGIMLGILRVISGVHFPKDVIAGGVVGILFGILANVLFHFI